MLKRKYKKQAQLHPPYQDLLSPFFTSLNDLDNVKNLTVFKKNHSALQQLLTGAGVENKCTFVKYTSMEGFYSFKKGKTI